MIPIPSAAGRANFWDSRFDAAQRAVNGVVTRDLTIGPCRLRFHLAGPALLDRLLVSFEHLLGDPSADQPNLSVYCWDSVSTGIVPQPELYSNEEGSGSSETTTVRFDPITGVVRAISESRTRAWWTVPDANRLHYYCRSAPLRDFLHVGLEKSGMCLLHGGVVGGPDGGVLLGGAGGTGKSTTTMACLDAGMGVVSEDFTAVQSGAKPYAWGIYSCAKVNDDTLRWFPRLAPHVVNPDHGVEEKNLIYLQRAWSSQLLRGVPLRAVFIVGRNSSAATHLVPATRAEVLRALAPSTILLLRNAGELQDGAAELAEHARLLRHLPCYRILTGSDMAGIPRTICDFLSSQ